MNSVDISSTGDKPPPWEAAARSFMLKALETLSIDNWDLSVLFCDDAFIKDLNARYRNRDEATDVLSFPLGENEDGRNGGRYIPGDIVISLDTLHENARVFGVSVDEELKRLLIHGILHLEGRDHATNSRDEPMLALQETTLAALAGETIL